MGKQTFTEDDFYMSEKQDGWNDCIEAMKDKLKGESERMKEPDSYDLIKHLRKAQEKWFEKYDYDGAYWKVNIEILEMDSSFTQVLKRIVDEDRR